jgi:hypothetical protein
VLAHKNLHLATIFFFKFTVLPQFSVKLSNLPTVFTVLVP